MLSLLPDLTLGLNEYFADNVFAVVSSCRCVEVEGMVSKVIHSCDTVMLRAPRRAAASGPHSLSTSLRDHDALRRLCHSLRSHYF